MQDEIMINLDKPTQLEKLYRSNKSAFKKTFDLLYPKIESNPTAQVWHARLNFESGELSWGSKYELMMVIALSAVACIIAKLPVMAGWNDEIFYTKNMAFIALPALTMYFAWKQAMSIPKTLSVLGIQVAAAFYINQLPGTLYNSSTLMLACIHLPLFLWMILGFAFTGGEYRNYDKRLNFLRYNGDLVVITTLILIAGALLTGITIGLFDLIHVRIEEMYFNHVVVYGLASCTIVGTYLVQSNPQLVKNVSPVIAKVFAPLVLVTLVVYLLTMVNTGKSPFTNREYLIIFNMLLIGVMAIILFSVAETSKNSEKRINTLILLALSIVTIVVNTIALSAIVYRISEWGVSPNRVAVLGGNVLILTNLMMVSYHLFKSLRNTKELANVEKSIAVFLPVYGIWTMIVTFIFPVVFNFI